MRVERVTTSQQIRSKHKLNKIQQHINVLMMSLTIHSYHCIDDKLESFIICEWLNNSYTKIITHNYNNMQIEKHNTSNRI